MRKILALIVALMIPAAADALTLAEFQAEAEAWVVTRWDTIKTRVQTCLGEPGGPQKCHTAWAASTYCNNTAEDPGLCTLTLDDPGVLANTVCGICYTGDQTFALAGITIPGTAPLNAKINVMQNGSNWGEQLLIRIVFEGDLYERGWGAGIAPDVDWHVVEGEEFTIE